MIDLLSDVAAFGRIALGIVLAFFSLVKRPPDLALLGIACLLTWSGKAEKKT